VGNEFKDLFGDWEPRDEGRPLNGEEFVPEPENRVPRALNEKEVKVLGVFEHAAEPGLTAGPQTFVLLQDNHGRKVPIWIGRYEAFAISSALEGEQFDRPMTHDLIKLVIEKLGAEVERIIIDDLWQDTFYAKLVVSLNGNTIEIDCRPSDAVAVALRTRAPIYMAESVIDSVEQKF
jgi:hypothetical protein